MPILKSNIDNIQPDLILSDILGGLYSGPWKYLNNCRIIQKAMKQKSYQIPVVLGQTPTQVPQTRTGIGAINFNSDPTINSTEVTMKEYVYGWTLSTFVQNSEGWANHGEAIIREQFTAFMNRIAVDLINSMLTDTTLTLVNGAANDDLVTSASNRLKEVKTLFNKAGVPSLGTYLILTSAMRQQASAFYGDYNNVGVPGVQNNALNTKMEGFEVVETNVADNAPISASAAAGNGFAIYAPDTYIVNTPDMQVSGNGMTKTNVESKIVNTNGEMSGLTISLAYGNDISTNGGLRMVFSANLGIKHARNSSFVNIRGKA